MNVHAFIAKLLLKMRYIFFLECPFYDDLRRKLFKKANLCNSDFDALNFTENIQPLVANTVYDMWQRRKQVL